ncbi:hypothetical protein [Aquimarina agarilytica]|uniref:hypothetical protein n=1 Tax=Aquimarina agarilytica TaxID=1087449 RepID=UPI000287FF2E|nr:hypothetical protein [Aquimarina agarilytica]
MITDSLNDIEGVYSREAELFTAYLVSSPLNEREKKLYNKAMIHFDLKLSNFEKELLKKMMKSNINMATVDAGLAILKPSSLVRRKLFTMLAILEASPNYTSHFFSKEYSWSYYFKLLYVGVRAVCRTIAGVFIVKKIERKCI